MVEQIRVNGRPVIPLQEGPDCCAVEPVKLDTDTLSTQARLLAALADPTRLGIITMLAQRCDAMCVCEITPAFDLGQPTVSHHLKVLREAGLVECEKRGLWVHYWLNKDAVQRAGAYLSTLTGA